jgi:hypothetical protein
MKMLVVVLNNITHTGKAAIVVKASLMDFVSIPQSP